MTLAVVSRSFPAKTLLELKQQIPRLSARERRALNAYMIRLRPELPQWRRSASKRMAAMDAGKNVTAKA